MDSLHFLADREQELRDLIQSPENRDSVRAACRDVDVSLYHPEDGERAADGPLAVCVGCEGRLECLALALRAEDPEARHGWYGGLGPAGRDRIAAMLRLATVATPLPDRALTLTEFIVRKERQSTGMSWQLHAVWGGTARPLANFGSRQPALTSVVRPVRLS
ncbi:WhiB family transcriptional regulator [Streptomyces clavifer]|uniref:WhiB family transcriptional regulator n=1 Tax=Streptomyces clavifer TaxID=68188 RepID=UPI0037FA2E8B